MTESTDQLQQWVHRQQSEKLRNVIAQIDTISHLLLKMYEADFLGVFYHNESHQVMLPVSYQNWDSSELTGLENLEKQWLVNVDKLGHLDCTEYSAESDMEFWPADRFAAENKFSKHLLVPVYDAGHLRGVVLVYWRDAEADTEAPMSGAVMKALLQVLLKGIEILEQTHTMDSVMIRLSDVFRLFETDLVGTQLEEILRRLAKAAGQLLPGCGVTLVIRDPHSEACTIDTHSGVEVGNAEFCEALTKAATDFLVEKTRAGRAAGLVHRLYIARDHGVESAYAIDLSPKEKYRSAIVCYAENGAAISDTERDLLGIFHVFAQALLTNSVLLKDLTKSNVLIRESSDRLADIESLAAVADMTSGIAHRLNNVIGGIVGRLQLMQLKNADAAICQQLTQLEEMASEGARAVRRIQEFATCTRSSDHSQISLRDLLAAYRDDKTRYWRSLATHKQLSVVCYLPDAEAVYDACEADIRNMLDHLVMNAVEFAPEHSEVSVTLEQTEDQFRFTVTDRGPGIPEMVQKKIFYPFFSTKPDRDAGMGLAMVHALAIKQGGTVTFDSEPGEATAFHVSFDRPDSMEDTGKVIVKRNHQKEELKILVVDDDPQLREVLMDMLSLDGHEVICCPDAFAALETIKAQPFDMMITDLGMPGMSGLDLAGEVHDAHPSMAIAMITGWGTQLNDEEVALRGIKRVLSKPFHLRDIKSLVKELQP
jgi:signal transduction histidine kinase